MPLHEQAVHLHTEGVQGADIRTVAYITNPASGAAVVRADISGSIVLYVYDSSNKYALLFTETLASSAIWQTAVAQGYGMPLGYVLLHTVQDVTDFAQVGGRTYILEYEYTHTGIGPRVFVHEHKCLAKITA